MNQQEVAALEVGAEVAISSGSGGVERFRFATVTKRNGHGHVTVTLANDPTQTRTFDKYGDERDGSKYHKCYLVPAATAREHLAAGELDAKTRNAVNALLTSIAGHKNGMGKYFVSEETKAELLALVNAIPVNHVTAEV